VKSRSFFCILELACIALMGVIYAAGQSVNNQSAKNQTAATKLTEQTYKNIQVLKGLPSDQLIPAMQFITASLGVECSFCHVENHFDQDDKKPKQTARKMMKMMAAINQDNFDQHRVVTCNTCHRGSRRPVPIPTISEQPQSPTAITSDSEQQPAVGLPSPDQLIQKYIQSSGGKSALQKLSTRIEKGTADFAGHEVSVEIFDRSPAQRAIIMHLPIGDNVTAIDGDAGWSAAPGHPVREMPGADIEGAKMDADLQFPVHLQQLFDGMRAEQPERIGDHETYQVLALKNGSPRARLYFDKQSGLLVRVIRYSDSPLGLNPTRIDYSDYRAVDGVQVPYRSTIARPGGQFTIQVVEVQHNAPIPEEKFRRPPESVLAHSTTGN
jgi:photosynthetic reaction center cytochrome c subunit